VISAQAAPAAGAKTRGPAAFGGFATRWALLLSVAGGLALFAAFPPLDAWPLAVAGPALLVLALTGRSLRASFGCGLVFGLAFFVPLLSWLVNEAWYAWSALAGALALIFAVLCGSASGPPRWQAGGWRPRASGTGGPTPSPGAGWR
jgi:apolipoprotein N-acyltransferase